MEKFTRELGVETKSKEKENSYMKIKRFLKAISRIINPTVKEF